VIEWSIPFCPSAERDANDARRVPGSDRRRVDLLSFEAFLPCNCHRQDALTRGIDGVRAALRPDVNRHLLDALVEGHELASGFHVKSPLTSKNRTSDPGAEILFPGESSVRTRGIEGTPVRSKEDQTILADRRG
jgi:hypothetical protein